MNQVINNYNKEYAEKCFKEAINLGIDFKLNNNVNEKHFSKKILNDLIKLPLESSNPETILNEFKEKILPYCTNFSNEKFMGFPDAGIQYQD